MKSLIKAGLIVISLQIGIMAIAEETTMEKVETKTNEMIDDTKSTYRSAKDKACEMVNGKMECAGKRIKSKVKNAVDKAETKAKELKNKVD